MVKVFQVLAENDHGFLERFAALEKHGRKRRYLARNKYDLYPGRPDLANKTSKEIISNWWIGTNYSCQNIQTIIDLALEVAGSQFQSAKINLTKDKY